MIKNKLKTYNQLLCHLNMKLIQKFILQVFKKNILTNKIRNNSEIDIEVNSNYVYTLLYWLKNDSVFGNNNLLIDIVITDYPQNTARFKVTYNILSLNNIRINIITKITELTNILSITSLWPNAIWHERECFDFFGIHFLYHKDLRRILTDYGFQGFPLRKDFPLSGYVESYYDDNQKRIITKRTELTQTLKNWAYISKW